MSKNQKKQSQVLGIKKIFKFPHIRIYLIIIFGLHIILWMLGYSMKSNIDQELVVLHYNIDFGVDWIGNINKIFIIPIISLGMIIINLILAASSVRSRDFVFIAHLILFFTMLINIFLLISFGLIYLVNFR